MNIHPIFVHFPIALLTIYALLEIFRLPLLTRQNWYQPIKIFLLVIGTIAAFVTLQTGEMAEHAVGRTSLIEVHSQYATAATYIFAVLAVCYLLKLWAEYKNAPEFVRGINRVTSWLISPAMAILLALLGLLCITVAGTLGGAIVYGPEADPIVAIIYKLVIR